MTSLQLYVLFDAPKTREVLVLKLVLHCLVAGKLWSTVAGQPHGVGAVFGFGLAVGFITIDVASESLAFIFVVYLEYFQHLKYRHSKVCVCQYCQISPPECSLLWPWSWSTVLNRNDYLCFVHSIIHCISQQSTYVFYDIVWVSFLDGSGVNHLPPGSIHVHPGNDSFLYEHWHVNRH